MKYVDDLKEHLVGTLARMLIECQNSLSLFLSPHLGNLTYKVGPDQASSSESSGHADNAVLNGSIDMKVACFTS